MKEHISEQLFIKALGEKIAFYRSQKNFTQQKLAELLGITRASMNHIENGRTQLSVYRLFVLCSLLDVSLMNLLPSSVELKQIAAGEIPEDEQSQVVKILDRYKM